MPTPAELNIWFDTLLDSLPDKENDSAELFSNPPVGITQIKMKYRSIALKRSGPKGWTYFPMASDGTRLARVSYQSLIPNVYITAMVKLTDYEDFGEVITWTASGYAAVTIDNLTGYGKVEKRENNHLNKRQKLCIIHS